MEKRIFNAPYVRPEDSVFTAFCLYMLEVMAKPRFSLFGVLGWAFAIFGLILGLTILLNSAAPLWCVLGLAFMVAIPAIIGAAIRDKRIQRE